MEKQILKLLLLLFLPGWADAQNKTKFTISGYIKEAGSAELLIGASVSVPSIASGTVSNNYGFYSITLLPGKYQVVVTYVGYKPKAFEVELKADVTMDIELETSNEMKELVVSASKNVPKVSEESRMSVIEIPIQQIKDIPALLGEKDVLKVIQLMPGVQKGGEGNAGLYVRGGGPDQNLIILDDAIVYNAFHLFGFFSLFNGDALKSVELTKGGFPARFGGRLSSVIEMNMKEGNKQELHGEAGIGLLSSRLVLEGPLVKGKSSFLVSGRRTYIDAITEPFQPSFEKFGYYFYDVNAKANYELDSRNKLYLSGYFGRDKAKFKSNYGANTEDVGGISWGNVTGTLRWNHLFNPRCFANTSFIVSNYNFQVFEESTSNGIKYILNYNSGINDLALKHDLDYRPGTNHTIKAGAQIIRHNFIPSAVVLQDGFSGQNLDSKNTIGSFESAVYAEDDIKIGSRLKINPGLRLTSFSVQGKTYFNAEPRFNSNYKIKNDLAAKASFAVMNQYIHLLSNTGVGLPTDLWVPSTKNVLPERSWQVAAGLAKDFLDKDFTVTLEGYYKEAHHIIAYKEGASFFDVNPEELSTAGSTAWEQNITSGRMWSYGSELLIQKKTGKFTGWIGYTLSWTRMQFDELNNGKEFWAKYDRRHDISLVGIYRIREEGNGKNGVKVSATWVYGTGNAITLPIATYQAPTHQPGFQPKFIGYYEDVSLYTERNGFRMAPYHRLDFGLQVERKMKWWVRTWEFSVYNLYNRYNPYFYYIGYAPPSYQTKKLLQVTLFPIIPSISWNIKF